MKLTYLETLSLAITQLMHIKCVAFKCTWDQYCTVLIAAWSKSIYCNRIVFVCM